MLLRDDTDPMPGRAVAKPAKKGWRSAISLSSLKRAMSSRFDKSMPPAYVPPATRAKINAALAAADRATSFEEAMAATQMVVNAAREGYTPGTDPIAYMAAIFDIDTAEAVADVGAAAVDDLEAEAAPRSPGARSRRSPVRGRFGRRRPTTKFRSRTTRA